MITKNYLEVIEYLNSKWIEYTTIRDEDKVILITITEVPYNINELIRPLLDLGFEFDRSMHLNGWFKYDGE